jgi:hypothetical protein
MAKQIRISFRTSEAFKKRVQAVAALLKLDETVLETQAIEAVIEHVEKYGSITIPIKYLDPNVAAGAEIPAKGSPTPSTRFSLNEDPPPRTKPGVRKTIEGK